ncbi:hypothetical protein D9756_011546 [Leucocoprinus leucothites]|uniref:Uncharacterized protein n=1 Tax=Leucocoprinus leucothites TaxID=201217 RepID=A0A8H5CNB9_9AGAR|nr:hypothetical protein D9756_011546 [Leucoagaricus leucothites]
MAKRQRRTQRIGRNPAYVTPASNAAGLDGAHWTRDEAWSRRNRCRTFGARSMALGLASTSLNERRLAFTELHLHSSLCTLQESRTGTTTPTLNSFSAPPDLSLGPPSIQSLNRYRPLELRALKAKLDKLREEKESIHYVARGQDSTIVEGEPKNQAGYLHKMEGTRSRMDAELVSLQV